MRQGNDEISLLERLLRIRNGTVTQKDWININNRHEDGLPQHEKEQFNH